MLASPTAADPLAPRARARRGLAVYFACLLVGTAICEGIMLHAGDSIGHHPGCVMALMWTPGISSIIARIALREGFGDVSFRLQGRHGWRMLLVAWVFPLVVGLVAYGLAWSSGLDALAAPKMAKLGLEHASVPVKLAASIAISMTVSTWIGGLFAAGEEIGWRGYMLTRLIDAGIPQPILVSGLIWGTWHLPLIVSGQYAAGPHPALSAVLFLVDIVAAAYVAAHVRLESGSVWPAVMFHASWNAIIQDTFDHFTRGGDPAHGTTIWTGESGIVVVAVNVLLAAALVARRGAVRRVRGEGRATAG